MKGEWRFLLGLLLAILFCYLPGLNAPPAFDDALLQTYRLTRASPAALMKAFRDPVPASPQGISLPAYAYRPLTEASFVLNGLAGGGLMGLRVGNLLIHVGAAVLVWVLARRLGEACGVEGRWFGRWAALCFAVHPMGVQAVTYVYQRAVSLEALLVYGTLALYWRGRERPWGRAHAGAVGVGLLAMLAKEPAVTLPLWIGALEWVLRRPGEGLRPVLKRAWPFAVLPLLVVVQVARAMAQAAGSGPDRFRESGIHAVGYGFTPFQYLCLELPVVLGYLRLAALPFPLTFYGDRVYPLPGQAAGIPAGPTLVAGALLLGALGWILFGPARLRLPRLALALFLAPLALESSVFPIQDLAFHHRCYPGLLGASLGFAWVVTRLRRPLALGAGGLALLATLALGENRIWSASARLLERDVRHAFHRSTIWANLGWQYQDAGHPGAAERVFRQALRSPWQAQRNRVGLASALRAQGRTAEARQAFDRAVRDYPSDSSIVWMALVQALEAGDAGQVSALADRAAALPLLRPELALWLASTRLEEGRVSEAERILRRHLGVFRTSPQFWDLLGEALRRQARWGEAEEAYRAAIDLQPDLPDTHADLGRLYLLRGDARRAEAAFREALRCDPAHAGAREGLARAMRAP